MSEHIPTSSAEYAADQRCKLFGPHPCTTIDIQWHCEKNLMLSFYWNGQKREVNIAPFFRKELGKMTEEVRTKIVETMPEAVIISTRIIRFAPHKKRYIHEAALSDLNEWLERIQKKDEDPR